MKFRSYALTFRPFDGVTDKQISMLDKWCRKKTLYHKLITEKEGSSRHCHAAVFLEQEESRSNLVVKMTRLFPDLSTQEKRVWRQGVKVMYNEDFLGNYMDKEDDTVIISENLPEAGRLESFYPPKPDLSVVKKSKCSHYYHELEALWNKYVPLATDINTVTVRDFLFNMMYNERCLNVIRDDKSIVQVARHLVRWLNHAQHNTIELPPFEKEE